MPTLSVTLLGVLAAVGVLAATRTFPVYRLAGGILGAWVGFFVGAIAGLLIDIVLGDGVYLAYVGHAAALVGAVWFARRAGTPSGLRFGSRREQAK